MKKIFLVLAILMATMAASASNKLDFTHVQELRTVSFDVTASYLQPNVQVDPSSRTSRGTSTGTRSSDNGRGTSTGTRSGDNGRGTSTGTHSSEKGRGTSTGTRSSNNSRGTSTGTRSSDNGRGTSTGTRSSNNGRGTSTGTRSSDNNRGTSTGTRSNNNGRGTSAASAPTSSPSKATRKSTSFWEDIVNMSKIERNVSVTTSPTASTARN